jgi:hypothetical protein
MTNQNDRIITIITPVSGETIALKSWITGREQQAINAAMFEGVKVKPTASGGVETSSISLADAQKMDVSSIENIVVSINGNTENVKDAVLDMHIQDYNFILDAVRESAGGKKKSQDTNN